jgi:pSer/pThr/pTyr-binding forkhead associated (FHA) protein
MTSSRKPKFRFYLYNNDSGEFREVKDLAFVGRADADLDFPDDHLISRRHCRFSIGANDVYIEDFGSTNQTRVNGVPLTPHKRRRLLLNDVVEVGTQRLILTNQNKRAPSNVKDPERTRVYTATRKEDGSLTRFVTGLITKKTLVRVNKRVFQALQVKKAVRTLGLASMGRLRPELGRRERAKSSALRSFATSALILVSVLGGLHAAGLLEFKLNGIGARIRALASGEPAPVLRQASTEAPTDTPTDALDSTTGP